MSDYCGTPRGWDTHKADNEPPCKWCRKAVTKPAPVAPTYVYTPGSGQRVTGIPPCGTPSAYSRHLRLGEEVDTPCREAANARRRAYKKTRGARK